MDFFRAGSPVLAPDFPRGAFQGIKRKHKTSLGQQGCRINSALCRETRILIEKGKKPTYIINYHERGYKSIKIRALPGLESAREWGADSSKRPAGRSGIFDRERRGPVKIAQGGRFSYKKGRGVGREEFGWVIILNSYGLIPFSLSGAQKLLFSQHPERKIRPARGERWRRRDRFWWWMMSWDLASRCG
jgi:hypothetical protein